MIYINHEKKAIFIHMPKTGGTYIGPTLEKYYGFTSFKNLITCKRPDHDEICKTNIFKNISSGKPNLDIFFFNKCVGVLRYFRTSEYFNNLMNMNEEKWNTYIKFCFIRHPYDRAFSGWKHVDIALNKKSNFDSYLRINKYNVSDIEYAHVFMSQFEQIQNNDGTCGVDLIGKFETLEDDFRIILNRIGFDKILHTPKKVNVTNVKDAEKIVLEKKTIHVLNELFKDDLEIFHYKKIPV